MFLGIWVGFNIPPELVHTVLNAECCVVERVKKEEHKSDVLYVFGCDLLDDKHIQEPLICAPQTSHDGA